MMDLAEICVVMLASGLSRRFGAGDKLLAPFRGRPLAGHGAAAFQAGEVARRIAVVDAHGPACGALFAAEGWDVVENPDAAAGQGASLALGVRRALAPDGGRFAQRGLAVMLADMPFVGRAELAALCAAIGQADAAVSLARGARLPPVLFAPRIVRELAGLTGDAGARGILAGLADVAVVPIPDRSGVDIDTEADLMAWARNGEGEGEAGHG